MILKATVTYQDNQCMALIPRRTACGQNCAGCGGCDPGRGALAVEVENLIGASEGEHVFVEFPDRQPLLLMLMVFVVPLFILAGAFLLANLFWNQILSALAGFASTALYFAGLALFDRRYGRSRPAYGRIVKLADGPDDTCDED